MGHPLTPRLDVRFPSGKDECAAWLYLPDEARATAVSRRAPVVVMGHGFGAVRQCRLDAYAERFAAAGYACLVFDYRCFGESGGEPRQLVDVRRQLEDWASAIAYARSRDELDPERVAIWGSSFGGGHVLIAAARDRRVAAVISQCPFTDGIASARAMGFGSFVRVGVRSIADVAASLVRRGPVMIPIVGEPGTTAILATPDSEPGYMALIPPGLIWRNETPARIGIRSLFHRPGRAAARVECPVLFCVCESDSLAPAPATCKHAARAPRGEVHVYETGHFGVYQGEGFERAIGDQLDFLGRHLPTPMPAP